MHQLQVPDQLYNRILEQIRQEKSLRLRRRMFLFGASLALTLAGFVAALANLFNQVSTSGFLDLLHLASTDFHVVSTNLSDYLLSLIESFPIMSAALACGILLLLAWSCYKLAKDTFELRQL